jgi:ribonuclease P protein component
MRVPAGEGFPKAARVRRRREYLALGQKGRRRHATHFIVLAHQHPGGSRLGVTVSRKIGGAVTRNLVKRRVREAFRRHPHRLLRDHDLVVIAKPGAGDLAFDDIVRELTIALAPRSDMSRGRRA